MASALKSPIPISANSGLSYFQGQLFPLTIPCLPGRQPLHWLIQTTPSPTNYAVFWQQNANCYEYKQMILVLDTQDPIIENCPSAAVKICDISSNDPVWWNDNAWCDHTASHDLCEGVADLSITAYHACTGVNVRFRYLLSSRFDGNGSMETVVNSNNPPPAGFIYYNNANNPNFSGGDLRSYDSRPILTSRNIFFPYT